MEPAALGTPPSKTASVWAAIAAAVLGLAVAYLVKRQCLVHPWVEGFQYRRLCYNDIQPLFGVRGIDRGLIPYLDVAYEYPPLNGWFMDLMGRLLRLLVRWGALEANSNENYFRLSALFLAPFALAVTLILRPRVSRERLMMWAVGTPLILYAFVSWDLIAVAAAVWGMAALERGRSAQAGVALALGAGAKLYPAFLFPGALLGRLGAGDRRGAARLGLGFLLASALIHVPLIVLASRIPPILDNPNWAAIVGNVRLRAPNTNGWLGIWTFHASRFPDFDTAWFWIAHHGRALFPSGFWQVGASGYRDFVNLVGPLLFAAASLWFLRAGWAGRRAGGGYPAAAVGLGIVVSFLVVTKVYSPQYTLWLVPLLAAAGAPWGRVLGFFGADLAVFVSRFYFFTVIDAPAPGWKGIFEAAVLLRLVALVGLAWWAARAVRLRPAEVESAPSGLP